MSEFNNTMMMKSRSFPRKPPATQPLIKVTLESLKGISLKTRKRNNDLGDEGPVVPHVTAAVSFSGSLKDMQVGSSSLCPRSGNLLVESEPACLIPLKTTSPNTSIDTSGSDEDVFQLVAQWDKRDEVLQSGSPRRNSTKKPHLTIRLPSRDANLPSVPLEEMNRDCDVVENTRTTPELESSDLSSDGGAYILAKSTSDEDDGDEVASVTRGPSVVWSASGSGMPEIIELNVTLVAGKSDETLGLSCDDDEEDTEALATRAQEGIAYLVFFGQNDRVSTTMDLPVKKPQSQPPLVVSDGEASVVLDEDARIRIRVDVLPDGMDDVSSNNRLYSQSLLDTFGTTRFKRLEPILQQLRHESDHQQRVDDLIESPLAAERESAETPGVFCSGDRGFLSILKELKDAVRYCDEGDMYVHSGDSVASTLATAASLDI